MARPQAYKKKSGARVPSVTQIIKNANLSGEALKVWAFEQGKSGLYDNLFQAMEKAMGVGTIVHAMIEADIHGTEVSLLDLPADMVEQARRAFQTFLEWKEMVGFRPLVTEVSMVSEEHGFGGTLDAIVEIRHPTRKLVVADWKTGKLYPDHLIQVSAYRTLANEVGVLREDWPGYCEGALLLRVGKEDGQFDMHYRPETALELPLRCFLKLLDLHGDLAALKKVA